MRATIGLSTHVVVVDKLTWAALYNAHYTTCSLLCGARRPAICRGAVKNVAKTTLPKWRQTLLHGHGHGQWGLGGGICTRKKWGGLRLHFCNRQFFWQQKKLKTPKNGVQGFFLPPSPCSSLFNGPVCCPQPIVCNSCVTSGGAFCETRFLLLGTSHFEKKQVVGHARMQFSACVPPNK